MTKFIASVLLVVAIFACSSPIFAQSLDSLQQDYQRDVDTYRSLYTTFSVKKNEFAQFETFTAEEALVKAAQDMLLARADSWIAYWKMLAEYTKPVTALQTSSSSPLQDFYKTETNWLNQHKEQLINKKRRDDLMSEANTLNLKGDNYSALATKGTALLYLGRLQGITQQLLALNDALTQRVQTQTFEGQIKDTKLRGLQVNKDRLNSASQQLSQLEQSYAHDELISSESIDRIKIKYDPIYSDVQQLRQVLAELAGGVEW